MSQILNLRKSPSESFVPSRLSGAAIHTHPDDIVNDPDLSDADKRGILASWISDARAVENAPSLRRLDSGAVIEVDAIQQALVLLDELAPEHRSPCKGQAPLGRRRSVMSSLLKRLGSPLRSNDGRTVKPSLDRSVDPADESADVSGEQSKGNRYELDG